MRMLTGSDNKQQTHVTMMTGYLWFSEVNPNLPSLAHSQFVFHNFHLWAIYDTEATAIKNIKHSRERSLRFIIVYRFVLKNVLCFIFIIILFWLLYRTRGKLPSEKNTNFFYCLRKLLDFFKFAIKNSKKFFFIKFL